MISRLVLTLAVIAVIVVPRVKAEGLTEEQGDALISELQQIRQILEQMRRDGMAAAPSRRSVVPSIVKVTSAGSPILGAAEAPVTLVEFTDFQCPYCKRFFSNTFPRLKKEYIDTGKLRLVMRELPLEFHPFALKAAEAALCAGDQEKYWQMHDLLFESAPALQEQQLMSYADGLFLDMALFTKCMADHSHADVIDRDKVEAAKVGITGTPSFVIGRSTGDITNGKKIVGAKAFEEFASDIDTLITGRK